MSLTREAVDGFCTEGGSFHISWNVIVDADGEVHPVGNDRRCLQCASQTGHVADNARFFLADVMTIDWPNRGPGDPHSPLQDSAKRRHGVLLSMGDDRI